MGLARPIMIEAGSIIDWVSRGLSCGHHTWASNLALLAHANAGEELGLLAGMPILPSPTLKTT